MSFEARLLALESHIAQYDSVLIGIDKSVDLLVTEIRQFKCKVDIRFDELEGRFEHLNSRMCNIELTQAEHTVHLNHIEEKLEEFDQRLSRIEAKQEEHDQRLSRIEAKQEEHNQRLSRIEAKQEEHDQRFIRIETKLEEHDQQFSKLIEVLGDIKQLLLEKS